MRRLTTLIAAVAPLLFGGPGSAAPAGQQVVLGDVSIEQNADGSVTVIHASDGSIIQYDSFDILAGELVQFIQPGADARVLNRVFGSATQIDGTLLANGIVYILNPAGVFLNGDALIDVGGLVAAAGHMSDDDFVSGVDRFQLTGPVVNESGEVHGDAVALLGTRVENHGRIEAQDGVIALVAGDRVVLYRLGGRVHVEVDGPAGASEEPVGVVQAGHLLAGGGQAILAVGDHYSLALNHTGVTTGSDVELRGGRDGTLLVQGEIDARGEQGGEIRVLGDRIALLGAQLDASGSHGGGAIRIGGDLRGAGSLPTARRTFVDPGSVLRADAIDAGDGGSVVVWGDEAAVMAGTLSARGGASGGDGGFAEVSSLGLLDPSGTVDLRAPAGRAGTFLLDPQDIVIVGGSADGSDDPDASASQLASDTGTLGQILFGDLGDGSDPFQIFESEIEGTNANLVLEARNSVTVSGVFDNDAAGEGSGVVVVMDDNDLTIRTRNDTDDELGSGTTPGIDLGSVAWRTGGTGSIEVATGDDGMGGGGSGAAAGIAVGDLTTEGGSIDLHTANGAISAGNLTSSGLDADVGGAAGAIRLVAGSAGDVTTGDLTAQGGGGLTGAGGAGGLVSVTVSDGALSVGSVDSRGGGGATDGGNGGAVRLETSDPDASGGSAIAAGDIVSAGGAGLLGNGGNGGVVEVLSFGEPAASPPAGGGAVAVGNVDTTGGDGTGNGGAGGRISLIAFGVGDVAAGDLASAGGDGDSDGSGDREAGGGGGLVELGAADGDVVAGAIDSSGGDGSTVPDPDAPDPMNPLGARGRAGGVNIEAGFDGSGSVLLSGPLRAVDGAGGGSAVADRSVRLLAADAVEFSPAFAGPHIVTTEELNLGGETVGAGSTIEVDAVGLDADPVARDRRLQVAAGTSASVDVTTAGFDTFVVQATSADADISVTQEAVAGGGDAIEIDLVGAGSTSTLTRAHMLDPDIAGGATLQVQLQDDLEDVDDLALELVVAAGAVDGARDLFLLSEDDVLLADGAVTMHPTADAPTTIPGRLVQVLADFDADGTGSIQATGSGVAIDMNAEGVNPTAVLTLAAAEGVGAPGSPIGTANVDRLTGGSVASGGFHLVNSAGGDVTLARVSLPQDAGLPGGDPEPDTLLTEIDDAFGENDAVAVLAGDGDVEIENQAGGLVLAGRVGAVGDMGSGGNVSLSVTDPGAVIRFRDTLATAQVEAGGDVLLDGPLLATLDGEVMAGGDVTFTGAVDSDVATLTTRNLTVTSGGTVRFGGDVGSAFELRNLTVEGDVELTQDTSFDVLQVARFGAAIDASSDDAAGAAITAGDRVELSGDVGTAGRLLAFSADADEVVFDGAASQSVVAGAGGIALNANVPLPAPPAVATIGKQGGDLRLESVGGGVEIGANHKLTVDGLAELVGDSVQVGDVNALDIAVDAPSFTVLARPAGSVLVPGLGLVPDQGTDLIADTISTTSAPTTGGSGPPPRFATLSGVVDGAGAGGLEVASLSRPVTSADLVDAGGAFLDLAVAVPDPGNETEPDPQALSPLLPPRPGRQDAAGSALAPDAEAVLAFLRCSEAAGSGRETRACAPAPGSPLDSPRGEEIAERYRRLFGGSQQAREARRRMTENSAAASALRRDLAALLAQLRLLGMQEEAYQRVRDRLLSEVAGEQGREALLAAVRAESRGFPL